jgi:hypothetical protein
MCRCGARRRRRSSVVELGKRRWRRWRRSTAAGSWCRSCTRSLVVVSVTVSLSSVNAVVVPGKTSWVMLLDVALERLQQGVVRLDVLDVFLITVWKVSIET